MHSTNNKNIIIIIIIIIISCAITNICNKKKILNSVHNDLHVLLRGSNEQ